MKRMVLYILLGLLSISMVPAQTEASPVTGAYHFGFKKSQNGQLPSIDQEGFKSILQHNDAIFLGDTKQKELYLTFDNGYENGFHTCHTGCFAYQEGASCFLCDRSLSERSA